MREIAAKPLPVSIAGTRAPLPDTQETKEYPNTIARLGTTDQRPGKTKFCADEDQLEIDQLQMERRSEAAIEIT